MLAQAVDAQQPGPEPDLGSALLLEQALDAEVANFQAAAGPLAGLTDRFAKLGLFAAKDQVAAAFTAQGAQILADADRLLVLRTPYTPKGSGFDWWGGGRRRRWTPTGCATRPSSPPTWGRSGARWPTSPPATPSR